MTEVSPLPQQPPSPEQAPVPTNAAKNFLNKWSSSIAATGFGMMSINSGAMGLDSFARGDIKTGIFHLAASGIEGIAAGFMVKMQSIQNNRKNS